MAHFAQLDENNLVMNVIVIDNNVVDNLPFPESEPLGVTFCQSLYGPETIWKQTSYNASFRYNYAGAYYTFDATALPNGAFISPKPSPDAVLDTSTYTWVVPQQNNDPSQPPAVL
jgi:hypothetical protein